MNCKPGQRAIIIRETPIHECVGLRIGCPVTVDRLLSPAEGPAMLVILMAIVGPIWILRDGPSCPKGHSYCKGVWAVPDVCLRPFDPDSEPKTEDFEPEPTGQDISVDFDRVLTKV